MPHANLSYINDRWLESRIDEDAIYTLFSRVGITSWGAKQIINRHYLSGGTYGYPYSLPLDVIDRIATRLNGTHYMTWYQDYNQQAIEYFEANGQAINQALDYWRTWDDPALPKPTITTVDELGINHLEVGDLYIAIIGLFHLTGSENGNNHHLFIELIDTMGKRIDNHNPPLDLYWEWEGMKPEETPSPVRIDKPLSEPGANIGLSWKQVIRGFHVNNFAVDQFSGIHIRYGDDETGNAQGHHSHYLVLQKRRWTGGGATPPPDPDPEPPPVEPDPDPEPEPEKETVMLINKEWLDKQEINDDGFIVVKE